MDDEPRYLDQIDKLVTENVRLRAALTEMIDISQRNSEATLMLIAIRKCAQHALIKIGRDDELR